MKCDKKDLLLYAVTDRRWLGGRRLADQVEEALKGGVTFVQLREKDLDEERFLEEAREIKELCGRYQVPFVINDNVDIAQAVDADGVHVGLVGVDEGHVSPACAEIAGKNAAGSAGTYHCDFHFFSSS